VCAEQEKAPVAAKKLLGKFQSQEKDEFLIKKEATNTL
jgi:hypothetical protein